MKTKTLRIYFIPMITDVYVAKDGSAFEKATPYIMHHEDDDYECTVEVIPGVSKIRFAAVPDGVENYFWTYSDDQGTEEKLIGDGSEMRICEMDIPDDLPNGVTIYVEEGHRGVDFGHDSRDLYIKCDSDVVLIEEDMFEISQ